MGVLEAETIDNAWVSEAVVNFLRGPLYTHPLMSFIDESCLVFTPEEENKFQYSEVHDKFKELVDELLTMFLAELGLSGEEFFDQVSKAQDQLSGFVVSTILTVDDFLMFKAMMVKRNLDLTNLVLQAVEEARRASEEAKEAGPPPPTGTAAAEPGGEDPEGVKSESEALQEGRVPAPLGSAMDRRFQRARAPPPQALQVSRTLGESDGKRRELQQALRLLQLEDEDVAMAAALAASLKDCAAADTELADINQAIALSLALDAELRRMQLEQQHAGATAPETRQDEEQASCSSAKAPAAPSAPSPPTPASSAPPAAPTATASAASAPATAAPPPAPRVSDAAPAAAAGPRVSEASTSNVPFVVAVAAAPAVAAAAALPPVKLGPRSMAEAPGFVPQGSLSSLPPAKPRTSAEGAPPADALIPGAGSTFTNENSVQRRGAGYSSGGVGGASASSNVNPSPSNSNRSDLTAVREAAKEAAETQRSMVAMRSGAAPAGGQADQWMMAQKAKLVAAQRMEREAETAAYKQQQQQQPRQAQKGAKLGMGSAAAAAAATSLETDAKRAALRDRLAQGLKQSLMAPAVPQ
ncbi:MAG: hypothetical protein WDW36_007225 [Sanguina aurantia]